MSKRVDLAASRGRLAALWLGMAAFLIVLLVIQSVGNKYGSQVHRAWGWFLPSIVPTLSLILGTVAYQAKHRPAREQVDNFAYRCSLGLSVFYLALLAATLLLQPFSSGRTGLEWLELSNLWLGPVQGLTAVAVAVFFQAAEAKE